MHHVSHRDLTILSACYHLPAAETWQAADMVPDENDEAAVKAFLRQYIVPRIEQVEARLPGTRNRLKHSLRYYLTTQRLPAEAVFYAEEPVFPPPDDPFNYYRWAWEVLFPGEAYRLSSLDDYVEDRHESPP